jgi:4-amino-4-deoxy-L-arabinose transferase-like glycosyltransferase
VSADLIIIAGRVSVILMYLILAASLAWWVGRIAGRAASLAALILFAFEPTVLAHSRYVTTDIPVALFIWLTLMSW